jgi:hypothetical protein
MFTITPKLAGIVAAAAFLLMAPAAFAAIPDMSVRTAVKKAPKATKAPAKSVKAAAWSFPSCTPSAAAEYDPYTYSGDPCISTGPATTVGTIVLAPAIESGVVSRSQSNRQGGAFCNGNDEYEYIYSGCRS